MKLTKTLRVAVVLAAVASLATFGTAPASATTKGVVEFAGNATLHCPGFGYPGAPIPPPTVPPDLTPNNCPFGFTSDIRCANEIVNVDKPGKPPVVVGVGCTISATGTVTGFCGLSYGKGMGTFTDSTGNVVMILNFSFTAVGGTLVVSGVVDKPGTDQKGFITGVVEAVPPTAVLTAAGGSCVAKSATIFTIAGVVLFSLA